MRGPSPWRHFHAAAASRRPRPTAIRGASHETQRRRRVTSRRMLPRTTAQVAIRPRRHLAAEIPARSRNRESVTPAISWWNANMGKARSCSATACSAAPQGALRSFRIPLRTPRCAPRAFPRDALRPAPPSTLARLAQWRTVCNAFTRATNATAFKKTRPLRRGCARGEAAQGAWRAVPFRAPSWARPAPRSTNLASRSRAASTRLARPAETSGRRTWPLVGNDTMRRHPQANDELVTAHRGAQGSTL
jgi:hypothetical protein